MRNKALEIPDLSTLRKPDEDLSVVITITGDNGSSQLGVDIKNADCAQLWAASRVLQIMGDNMFLAQQNGDHARKLGRTQ